MLFYYLRETPFVRILLFFMLGFAIALLPWAIDSTVLMQVLFLIVGLCLLFHWHVYFQNVRFYALKNSTINGIWIVLGMYVWTSADPLASKFHYSKQKQEYWLVRITEINKVKKQSVQAQAQVFYGINSQRKVMHLDGAIRLLLQKDSIEGIELRYGDELLIPARCKAVPPPANPHEFDYRSYLYYKHITHQGFLQKDAFRVVGTQSGHHLVQWAYQARDAFITIFNTYIPSTDAQNLLVALVLGYRSDLSKDIVNAFTDTGTTHVLSVSGLHVGIIYYVFNLLLGWILPKTRKGILVKGLLIFLLIWFYALITGLSPCICRAAVMISFIVVAKASDKRLNTYNLIACSAFLLLLYDPFLINDVGFQLSYAALTGIIFLQPKIDAWLVVESKIAKEIWMLIGVSLAAQVSTLPITLYYFHQFPNYFLVANVIVIPLSTLLLYGGILLLIVAPIQSIATGVGYILDYIVGLMNASLLWIQQMPYSTIKDISMDNFGMCLLTGLLIIGLVYCFYPGIRKLYGVLIYCCCYVGWGTIVAFQQQHQEAIVFYQVNKTVIPAYIRGDKALLILQQAVDTMAIPFHVQPDLTARQIQSYNWHCSGTKYASDFACVDRELMQFGKQLICIVAKNSKLATKSGLKVDYLVVNQDVSINQLRGYIYPKHIILGPALAAYQCSNIKQWAKFMKIDCYEMQQNGALTIEL